MAGKRTDRNAPPIQLKRTGGILDSFTERDLEYWTARSIDFQRYSDHVYFDLEKERARHHEALCAALQSTPSIEINVDGWIRVTDYRWSLTPLSSAGSTKGIGGRFNIGDDLDRARGQHFPALYIASTVETGFSEFFGASINSKDAKLTLHELALRRSTSFTTFTLSGHVENVLDLRAHRHLKPFTDIIRKFKLSDDTLKFGLKAKLQPRLLVRNTEMLWDRVLAPPTVWRGEPQIFGIPAPSQIFGRFVRDAGIEAVIYPSQQNGQQGDGECLAIYPQNLERSGSRIEVVGGFPVGATCTVLDKDHPCS